MDEKNPHAGSTLESLLREDGTYDEIYRKWFGVRN